MIYLKFRLTTWDPGESSAGKTYKNMLKKLLPQKKEKRKKEGVLTYNQHRQPGQRHFNRQHKGRHWNSWNKKKPTKQKQNLNHLVAPLVHDASQLTGYCNLGSAERKSGSKTTNMSNLSTAQTKTHHYGHRVWLSLKSDQFLWPEGRHLTIT